jgi:hypothetical protein
MNQQQCNAIFTEAGLPADSFGDPSVALITVQSGYKIDPLVYKFKKVDWTNQIIRFDRYNGGTDVESFVIYDVSLLESIVFTPVADAQPNTGMDPFNY